MSWNHSSRLTLVVAIVLLAFAAAGVASAFTVTQEDVPQSAEVESEITVVVEFEDLYANQSTWNLEGSTHLEDATWTVEYLQRDEVVDTQEHSGGVFNQGPIDESNRNAPTSIRVEVTGTVPAIDEYSYAENDTFRGMDLLQIYDDGTDWTVVGDWFVHHYSADSRDARQALDAANATIQSERDAGTDVSTAESTFEDAVSAYDAGDLDEAASLADQAEQEAQDGASASDADGEGNQSDGDGSDTDGSQETDSGGDQDGGESADSADDGDSTDDSGEQAGGDSDDGGGGLLSIVLALLLLGLLGGGGFWYYQQQQGPSRDPLG